MIPQILPRSLGAQEDAAVDRPYPPKGINITNQASISTKDPLPTDLIKPPNHAKTRAKSISSLWVPFVLVSYSFHIGFAFIILYIYTELMQSTNLNLKGSINPQ